jgi:hypothetical protein
MPSSNDRSPPESFDVSYVEPVRSALAIAGAITFNLDLAFFALLIAAFQGRVRLRLQTALGSALPFAYVTATVDYACLGFEIRHILVGLTALGMLGYTVATFKGRELSLEGQLAFMKGVSRLSNPRFGADCAIGLLMFPPLKLLAGYKGQVRAEGGFHFLKDPRFLASLTYPKTLSRLWRC